MKRLRLLALTLALLVVAAVAVLAGPLRDRGQEALRALIEREVGAVLGAPCTLEALSITLVPPGVDLRGLRLGAGGAVASLAAARVDLRPRTSLRQGRPVLDVDVGQVAIDLPGLLRALSPAAPGTAPPLPPFRLRRVRVRDARVRLTDASPPLVATASLTEGRLSAEGVPGRLRFAARAAPLTVEHGARSVTLAQVEARGGETAGGWQLRHVVVRGDGVALAGAERDGGLRLEGDLDLARLAVIDDRLDALRGAAHLEGRLEGAVEVPVLTATVTVPALHAGERALGEVRAEARLDRVQVVVSTARLRGLGGAAEGSGTLRFDDPLTTTARLSWRGLALRELADAATAVPVAALDGELEASGTLDPLRLAAAGSGGVAAAGGAPPVQWKGSGRYAAGGGALVVELAQGNGNAANADLAVAADGALTGTARLRLADPTALADLAAIGSLPDLRGALEANATLGGTLRDPRLAGAIDGRALMVAGVRVDAISGPFAADRAEVRSDGLRAAFGGGTLTARGGVALDRLGANAWSVTASGIDGNAVAALAGGLGGVRPPIAGGRVTLDAAASGPWPRVALTGRARLDDFWLGRERIAELAADVRASDGGWTVDGQMRNRARQEVVLRASGRGDQDLVVSLACDGWTLTSLWQGEAAEMGGTLRGNAALRGPARALSGSAAVTAEDLVLGGRAFGTVRVDVTADRGRWRATTALLDDALRLSAEVRPDPGLPFTVDGTWSDADVARLLGQPRGLQVLTSGTLNARGRLDAAAQAEARADVTRLEILGGAKAVAADVPVGIVCRRGVCVLDGLTLRAGKTSLRVGGEAGVDGRLRLTLAGGGTLGLLELIGEPIESARGTFGVDATVAHGTAGWTMVGSLTLDQVGLDAGLPVAITRGSGRVTFAADVVHVESFAGRIGSGTFSIAGDVDLRRGPALTWTLADVAAIPLPNLEVELSGSGVLDGTWQRLRVGGDLRIDRLLYDRDIELADFLPRLNRALAAAPRPERESEVELALNVTAPGELFVENNLTRLEARARLAITGTAARPILVGRVEALDGEVYLRGRTFDLLDATLDFRPDLGMAAALNISAESLIDTPDASYVVGVRVTGTTAEPRVTLSSDDPSLSQTDIAALIAFGRTTAQMRQGGGGSFSISGALGGQIGDLLSGQAERVLPVDRIDFQPTFSTTTGAFEPQLTLGKDLTEDLTASVGQTFGVASRTRVEVNYRLGPRVWAVGSWESQTETEAGAFAGGLRARYEFWRLTPFTLLSGVQ